MKRHFLFIAGLLFSIQVIAQTGIGTTTPNASAKLDVYSDNKGFLPPRVSLSGVTDQSTIPSPATGLLVYCKGDAGLAAGYYYWNGNAWATIATAGGSGSFAASFLRGSRTASQASIAVGGIVSFSAVDNTAGSDISLSTSDGKITLRPGNTYRLIAAVPNFTGNRPAFMWYNETSSSYIGSASNAYSPTDGASGAGAFGGLAEVIITPSVSTVLSFRLLSSLSSGSVTVGGLADFTASGSYPWFEVQVISGNSPVTGQSVDYAMANLSTTQSLSNAGNIVFNTITGTGITLISGGFNLVANKTYKLEAALGGSSGGYAYYAWVDNTNTLLSGGSIGAISKSGGTVTDGMQDKAVVYYTPTSNTTVYLRVISVSGGVTAYSPSSAVASNYSSTWASIQQIGSSAIINPWTLSGTNTFNTTGNVGIGNNAPTAILDVTGDTKVSGVLTAGGNTYPTATGTNGQALTTNGTGAASWNPVPPPGVITAFAGSTAPTGYLLCNGATVSRTTYAALFAIIGTTYGSGDGSTTFAVPDLRSKMIVGVGQGSGLTNRTLASTGGIESKTLSIAEMPSHTHTITDPGHTHSQNTINDDFNNSGGNPPGFSADGAGSRTWSNINSSTTGISINSSGSSTAFSVMNPFMALNYIIKY